MHYSFDRKDWILPPELVPRLETGDKDIVLSKTAREYLDQDAKLQDAFRRALMTELEKVERKFHSFESVFFSEFIAKATANRFLAHLKNEADETKKV